MKTAFLFLVIFSFPLLSFQQQIRKKFSIELNYSASLIRRVKYFINQNVIKVIASEDFNTSNAKTVYAKQIPAKLSDSLYALLKRVRIDTLKKYYEYSSTTSDGLYTYYKIAGERLKLTKVTTYETFIPATDSIVDFIKSRLLPEKYHPYNFMQ